MKKLVLLFILPFLAMMLFADEISETEEITNTAKRDNAEEIASAEETSAASASGEFYFQISSLPELKIGYTHTFKFPFLRLNNFLMSDNNIRFSLTGEVTPISMNGIIDAVLTPVAFLEFKIGGGIGSGWPLKLFGSNLYGIGLNLPDADNNASYSGKAFDALFLKFFAGGTFQFDFAAIFPGDWHHVVVLSNHEINYHHNTRAKDGQPWYYEADDGENRNGWNYFGNIVLGYQMPIFLNMVAFMAEMNLYLYKKVPSLEIGRDRALWGDDLVRWTFSNILNFQVTKQFSLALITQFRTRRNFTNFNEKEARKAKEPFLHYQYRDLNTANKLRLEFYRVVLIGSYTY